MAEQQMLSEAEFARAVGVSARTLQRYRRDNLIQHRRVGWKIYYLLPDDLDDWHEKMKRPARVERPTARILKRIG